MAAWSLKGTRHTSQTTDLPLQKRSAKLHHHRIQSKHQAPWVQCQVVHWNSKYSVAYILPLVGTLWEHSTQNSSSQNYSNWSSLSSLSLSKSLNFSCLKDAEWFSTPCFLTFSSVGSSYTIHSQCSWTVSLGKLHQRGTIPTGILFEVSLTCFIIKYR